MGDDEGHHGTRGAGRIGVRRVSDNVPTADREAGQLVQRFWPLEVMTGVIGAISLILGGLVVYSTEGSVLPSAGWLVVAALIGVAVVLQAWTLVRTRRDILILASDPKTLLSRRVERLHASLRDAAQLIDELRAELEARTSALEQLRVDAEDYETVAALRRDEAAAVTRLIEGVIGRAHGKLERRQLWTNVGFFVLGVVATVVLTLVLGH